MNIPARPDGSLPTSFGSWNALRATCTASVPERLPFGTILIGFPRSLVSFPDTYEYEFNEFIADESLSQYENGVSSRAEYR